MRAKSSLLPRKARRARPMLAAIAVGMLGLIGCRADTVAPFEPITDPSQLYLRLGLNRVAINLSTVPSFDTFQLTATPFDATGAPMAGLPAPTFVSSDTTVVTVSPTGMLTAVGAGTGIAVVAELRGAGNVRHVDTAIVNVNVTTDPPPELATLSIHSAPPDSAIIGMSGVAGGLPKPVFWMLFSGILPPGAPLAGQVDLSPRLRASTSGGEAIPNLTIEYASLDSTIAAIDRHTGYLIALHPGLARVVARTVAYGVEKADTAVYTITTPFSQNIAITDRGPGTSIFGPPLILRPNGIVFWGNQLSTAVSVVFDDSLSAGLPPAALCLRTITSFPDPEACGSGNFVVAGGNGADTVYYKIRQFALPGVYPFRDTLSGAVGKIIVTDSLIPGS